ncbi:enolase C-terminal domain-like protein [Streptomyces griseorubiginosus]|uniref:enolase C-terminal domain-like protein n=1 Tax=Streptomyces griseorubiginosus TaxID=67304 RepID=UPI001AD6387F|nr:enolase C-terminal domain-like protein [Streptomyces griseorubiginosus]MBO4258128.1 mandelate racemase [Streptomyces griseorubiginosus]
MKITDLRILRHQQPNPSDVGPPVLPLDLMTISTDEGIEGHTFVGAPGEDIAELLVRQVKPALLGQDALDIGRIWAMTGRRGLPATAQGAVDVALWDIAAKAAGLPLHRLLGTVKHRAPVYTSSWMHHAAETYVEEALAYQEAGLRGHKLHPLTQLRAFTGAEVPVTADIDLCERVRAAVGVDFPLFMDPAFAYTYGEAVRVGQAIQDLGYEWYEDPLPADDLYGYVRLKQQLSIPVMATEVTGGGLTALAPWVVERATDFLRGDVVLKGGITGMLKIAHLAEAFHLPCEIHDAYHSLNNLASLHLILALPNCEWFEVLVPHSPGSYDLDHLSYGLAEPVPIDKDGYASAPDRPGLGIEPDWDLLRSGAVDELG